MSATTSTTTSTTTTTSTITTTSTSTSQPNTDAATQVIRQKLNNEKIKLWLPPYTQDDASSSTGVYPEELLDRYSSELNLPKETVEDTMEKLRQHALAKLASRQNKPELGTIILKVKLTGNIPGDISSSAGSSLDVEVKLEITGGELRKRISEKSGIPQDHLKLISCGSVIQDEPSIYSQHVRQGSQVMVICLSESELEARQQEEQASKLIKTKEAVSILAKSRHGQNGAYCN